MYSIIFVVIEMRDTYMKVEILCPLYNAEIYVEELNKNINKQKNVDFEVRYLLTESSDNTKKILDKNHLKYDLIKKEDFSHSLTRENAAKKSNADIIVFVTQDVEIESEYWLYNLVKDIIAKKVAAAYSRQITKFNNLEKYTREKNYPETSKVVSEKDIKQLGLKTFFFSDASSAIDKKVFEKLNYYDGKKLPISEDMYIAYKLITNGYKILYSAESVVYHSHNFKLRELYSRYKLTGKFFKQNSYLDKYGTNASGGLLARYVFKRSIEERNIKAIMRFPFDMGVRFIGMKVGKYGK